MEIGNKSILIMISVILIVIFIFTISLIYESEDYKKQYVSCIDKYNSLANNYAIVLQSYNSTANEQIGDYNGVIDKYNLLVEKYNKLLKIEEQSLNPPYIQMINRTIKLNFKFENDTTLQKWTWPIESLEDSFYKGKIMREKNISDMDLYLPGLSEKFNNTRYLIIDKQMVIDLRPYIEEKHFDSFGKYIYKKYSTDEERIESVWYVATSLGEYTAELEETPRLPLETLLGAGGDCEDTAVLVASMLKAMDPDWQVDLVYVDLENLEEPKNINHVLVYIDTGAYSTYIETTSKVQMSPYEEVEGYHFEIN